jgi:hypothetical protein
MLFGLSTRVNAFGKIGVRTQWRFPSLPHHNKRLITTERWNPEIQAALDAHYTREQLDDREICATDYEPRYWFCLMGGQNRYKEWGYVVYRTTYNSEEKWEKTLAIIRRKIKEQWEGTIQEGEVDKRLLARWMPKFRLKIMSDVDKYGGLSVSEVQKHFREWAIRDFDAIIKRGGIEPDDHYDDTWGPYDRDELVDDDEVPGTTEDDREQNKKFFLSNKGAMHQACLMVDDESMKSILDNDEIGMHGNLKLVDVCAAEDGVEKEYFNCSVGSLGSGWALITHHGSLLLYVRLSFAPSPY